MRSGNATLGQWSYILVRLLIFLRTAYSEVDITIVENAVARGAVCSDGSPPAYHFDKGVGEGANNWLVHLEGGGWCESIERCSFRAGGDVGFSKHMTKLNFTGILNRKKEIVVRYCDGSSFTGDVEEVDPVKKLYFRGARIFRAVMEELLAQGMQNASNALLSGCSAGGLATILHCDNFRDLLPNSSRVKCVSDAGYFIHAYGLLVCTTQSLMGSAKNLPPSCTSKMEPSLCFYPQYVVPQLKTPLFIVNSAYDTWQIENILAPKRAESSDSWKSCKFNIRKCSPSQARMWQDFRSELLSAVTGLDESSSRGTFINSCHTHCQTKLDAKWRGDASSKLMNKTISEAVGDWYYDRSGFQQIDREHEWPQLCVLDPMEHPPDYP
ncbi:hypothetical protein RJ639_017246 [Escallonia herrerae]|uniref:Pectin acetylesterase n=1 Tax=Escallonia herrerae TaxID=1293975 RepID=A0AA88VDG0_9ASTE|nr:hypothetical protein RJ639_017246 [Escallonia herrerae]